MNDGSLLRSQILEDMKHAMRAHEQDRLTTIRLLLAAIKQREVDERITLDDVQILAVIDKMQKQLKDSIEQFNNAQRLDLVAKETFQLEIIQAYLPKPLTADEIQQLVKAAITATQATSAKDMGKVINELRPKVQGRADLGEISSMVKNLLNTPAS